MMKLSPEELETTKFVRGKGCPDCRGSGYKGRIGVFEMLMGTTEFRQAVARNAPYAELVAAARAQGYRTMLEDGRAKVLQGWTTPSEVIRAVYTQAMD